ncbi:MBL fold metallo-hydrolase [Paenibacillus roseipurpureus]|uniref:MBL fold metallo-hydrolase n=1 Tax=Paenibacillus roseopurpureus TaxID=2918901 RepID=A0AA96RMH3_9BACL|nr:MBL fold metallo-hydrolase [Paenibacillus sp. MBLB1832]WNR44212.1 MBL fold metallo-hydrolase [Paenibacillus sp. MBLB1832]
MSIQQLHDGVHMLPIGTVNVFVVKTVDGLVLIDTGNPGSAPRILEGIQAIGYKPYDLKTILLTHGHPDHAGGAAALKHAVPHVSIYISEQDAPIVEKGVPQRPLQPTPGVMNKLLFRLFIKETPIEAFPVDGYLKPNDTLAFAGGLRTIPAPAHSSGQLAFYLPTQGGVMFAADAAANIMGLGFSIGYENFAQAKQDLIALGREDFNVACFGHGKPILANASQKFRAKWS